MVIPLPALPVWAAATLNLAASLVFLLYKDSYWSRHARSFLRTSLFGALLLVAQGLLLSAENGATARLLYSFFLPLAAFSELALVDSVIVIFHMRRPRWIRFLWWGAVALLILSIFLRTHLYPLFDRVPDGFYLRPNGFHPLFAGLKAGVYWALALILIAFVISGLHRQVRRRRWPYLAACAVGCLTTLEDTLLVQYRQTLFPTTWILSILILAFLGMELRRHIAQTYHTLHHDSLTGAFSRSYGEFYLRQILQKDSLGLLYLDVDEFKTINDTFGHLQGDRVLVRIVQVLRSVAPPPNAIVRLGGDEFLLGFPRCEATDRDSFVSLARGALQSGLIGPRRNAGGQEGGTLLRTQVDVSLGWSYAGPGASYEEHVHLADLAMLAEKAARRRTRLAARPEDR